MKENYYQGQTLKQPYLVIAHYPDSIGKYAKSGNFSKLHIGQKLDDS